MLVYRMAPSHFMLVVNAANTAKDFAWISEQIKAVGDVGSDRLEQPLRVDRRCRGRPRARSCSR